MSRVDERGRRASAARWGARLTGAAAFASGVLAADPAQAQVGDDRAYAAIGFGIIVGGGVTSSVGTQLALLEGRPWREWAVSAPV